jgi:hypothetical protein
VLQTWHLGRDGPGDADPLLGDTAGSVEYWTLLDFLPLATMQLLCSADVDLCL